MLAFDTHLCLDLVNLALRSLGIEVLERQEGLDGEDASNRRRLSGVRSAT
jgi:hypothetical protein